MKLLPSPSISSSSTTSFDPNTCASKSDTASCLTGLLRRILCSRSLPTHPSDHITETSSVVCDNKLQECVKSNEATATTTPGIVARLMGLKSLPETADSVETKVSSNAISRSLSMNSVEFRGEGDQKQAQHRRVKRTLSFREMPTFLELENEEYFVLSFENVGRDQGKKVRSKERKCEVGSGELKEKIREDGKGKKKRRDKLEESKNEEKIQKMVLRVQNEAELSNRISEDKHPQQVGNGGKIEEHSPDMSLINGCGNTFLEDGKRSHRLCHKESSDNTGARLRKNNRKMNGCELENEELECSSQDSSPVSVLDFNQFIIEPETTSEEDAKSGQSNSRRKLLSPQLENQNHKHLSQRSDGNLILDDRNSRKTEETCPGSRKKVCHHHHYLNTWDEICKLTEAQVVETNWNAYRKICEFKFEEDFEEICTDFGLQILNQLLRELVDQLA